MRISIRSIYATALTVAAADLDPKLLSSLDQVVAGRWRRVYTKCLPSSAGWLTMRFLVLPVKEQLKHALASCVLGPAHMPNLFKQAEQLWRSAHTVHVSGSFAAHLDARPENIMIFGRGMQFQADEAD